MADIAIVVAANKAGLTAVAGSADLTIIEGTEQPFTGLETYSIPLLSSVGVIRTDRGGWIAFAKVN